MKFIKPGKSTSAVEIGNISAHGVWLFVVDREFFLPYEDYPWFRDATVGQILNVKLLHGRHLHWPDLDVDLELGLLADPARYPLIDRVAERRPRKH